MTITTEKVSKDPLCEGWLEKLALRRGFSLLASKGWNRRYCFLTRRGLGYGHTAPREKGNIGAKVPLRQADAKCFIPFDRHKGREIVLLPVYYVRDVSVTKNPEVPSESVNGICTNMAVCPEDGKPRRYYYFGITFEEKKKRYTLFLRTDSPQEYIKWTAFLPLYVHQACQSTLVPFAHPLEVNRQPPVDMNRRRHVSKDSEAVSEGYYLRDPDPCTSEEYQTVRRRCLQWDEGERVRVFPAAKAHVKSRAAGSDVLATKSLEEEQALTYEQRLERLNAIANALCAEVGDDAPNSDGDGDEGGDVSADSVLERAQAAEAATRGVHNGQDGTNPIVVGSAHDADGSDVKELGASGTRHVAPQKQRSRHKSSHKHHSKHAHKDAKLNGGGDGALFSNASDSAPPPPADTYPGQGSGASLDGTRAANQDVMMGSNDTNGPASREGKPQKKKSSRHTKANHDRQQAVPDGANNHVDPGKGVLRIH